MYAYISPSITVLVISIAHVTGITAFVFCICIANIECHGGAYMLPITIVIAISVTILLTILVMLYRLPQAIETLSFKVSTHFVQYTIYHKTPILYCL